MLQSVDIKKEGTLKTAEFKDPAGMACRKNPCGNGEFSESKIYVWA